MIVYHGSVVSVENPQILDSQRLLDFGAGFYTTTNREQAVRWSQRVAARRKTDTRYLSKYEFDIEKAEKELQILRFEEPDAAWLTFVCDNRAGREPKQAYDIAIGPVADDMVYTAVTLYEQGVLELDETIKRLKIQPLYDQVLFHTEKSLVFCKYVKHEEIGGKADE
ncbi:MAG: DUF3990 domain-containing protein [Oscillospiraceae bacterium]|jgi:hypothetical protein|nr:DUF3990 domain-containing protein [Oscillospiraceae bacterium]